MKTIFLILTLSYLCQSKEAVLILGAPRSGTSVVTAVLQILGVSLGENIRNYPLPWNAKGDFEDNDVTDIDADILYDLNIDPYSKDLHYRKYNTNWVLHYKNKIKDLFKNRFSQYARFGIKHPKMCLVLPLYIKAAQELGYKVKLVIVLRHPKEIMFSNKANTNKLIRSFTTDNECMIYLFNFWYAIFKYSIGSDKLIITYDDLLNNAQKTVEKMRAFLPGLNTYDEAKDQISGFLDKSLKHY